MAQTQWFSLLDELNLGEFVTRSDIFDDQIPHVANNEDDPIDAQGHELVEDLTNDRLPRHMEQWFRPGMRMRPEACPDSGDG